MVNAGAREDRLGPIMVDAAGSVWLAVKVRAPAQAGRANEAVCRLVAAALGIAPGRVTLLAGRTDRRKRLALAAVAAAQLEEIAAALPAAAR